MRAKRTTSPARTEAAAGATVARATVFGTTVTVQLELAFPAVAVMVALPTARAVTRPSALTSTTPGRVDFHVTQS